MEDVVELTEKRARPEDVWAATKAAYRSIVDSEVAERKARTERLRQARLAISAVSAR